MLGDVLDNLLRRPGVFHLRIAVGPRSTVMKRVPRGAEVGAGFRGIAVLPETVADTNLIVPKRLEKIDEISLGRILPSALNDQGTILEVLQLQGLRRLHNGSTMVA